MPTWPTSAMAFTGRAASAGEAEAACFCCQTQCLTLPVLLGFEFCWHMVFSQPMLLHHVGYRTEHMTPTAASKNRCVTLFHCSSPFPSRGLQVLQGTEHQ